MTHPPDLSRWPGAHWRDSDNRERETYGTVGWVCVDVTLRRVADGVERVHVDRAGFPCRVGDEADVADAIDAAQFWWSDGNGGCDCNRRLFFHRAANEPYDDSRESCTWDEFVIVAPEWLATYETSESAT